MFSSKFKFFLQNSLSYPNVQPGNLTNSHNHQKMQGKGQDNSNQDFEFVVALCVLSKVLETTR